MHAWHSTVVTHQSIWTGLEQVLHFPFTRSVTLPQRRAFTDASLMMHTFAIRIRKLPSPWCLSPLLVKNPPLMPCPVSNACGSNVITCVPSCPIMNDPIPWADPLLLPLPFPYPILTPLVGAVYTAKHHPFCFSAFQGGPNWFVTPVRSQLHLVALCCPAVRRNAAPAQQPRR